MPIPNRAASLPALASFVTVTALVYRVQHKRLAPNLFH